MTSKRVSPQRVRSRSKRSKTSDVLYETPGEPSPMSQVLPPLPPVVVFDMDSVIPPSPQPVYTKGDSITPDDWYDKAINQTLVDVAEKVEKNETERMERQMTNERYRLVHETVYPITKSGSKFLSVGVKPLADYALTLKIYNPEYTAGICFTVETFEDFLNQMEKKRNEMISIPEGQILCMLSDYVVVMCKRQILQFLPCSTTVYKSLFLSCDTVNIVLNMGEHLMSLLHSRRLQCKFYPCYQKFIN
nr:PREDICTED: uncharacterized protein LOC107398893 isoform X1 [Tribolium castaneum]|eukprot:XP_015839932.1 PREDICTED: uncharacterized protein LOC107398893 isoform X1 [Tribolium castaneum]